MPIKGVRHGEIAGKDVVERGYISRALDAGVSAQREDATAGPADIAHQQLQQGAGADDLWAFGVLGPTEGIAPSRRALASRVLGYRLRYL